MATQQFTKGQRVILATVRHESFKGQHATVLRYVKYCDSVDVLADNGKRYRAFSSNVTSAQPSAPLVFYGKETTLLKASLEQLAKP